jgi:hypothetical protein
MSSSQVLDNFHARNLPTSLIACYNSPTFTFSSWGYRMFIFSRGHHGAVTEMHK